MSRLYRDYIKRGLDFVLSGTAIVVLAPVLGVTALLVLSWQASIQNPCCRQLKLLFK